MSDKIEDQPVLSRADQALLRSALAPTDAQLTASRRAIAARIAALAASGAVASAASTAEATAAGSAASAATTGGATTLAAKSAALLGAAKWIGAGVLVTAVAGGAVVATQRAPRQERAAASATERHAPAVAAPGIAAPMAAPSEPPAESVAPRALTAPVPLREAAPVAKPIQPVRSVVARRESVLRASSAQALEGETLAGELALLRNAREALERGDARAALRELDAHAEQYAAPVLRQEALAARALALCAANRPADARRVAAQLARIAPRSPHLIGLADSCALEDRK